MGRVGNHTLALLGAPVPELVSPRQASSEGSASALLSNIHLPQTRPGEGAPHAAEGEGSRARKTRTAGSATQPGARVNVTVPGWVWYFPARFLYQLVFMDIEGKFNPDAAKEQGNLLAQATGKI